MISTAQKCPVLTRALKKNTSQVSQVTLQTLEKRDKKTGMCEKNNAQKNEYLCLYIIEIQHIRLCLFMPQSSANNLCICRKKVLSFLFIVQGCLFVLNFELCDYPSHHMLQWSVIQRKTQKGESQELQIITMLSYFPPALQINR